MPTPTSGRAPAGCRRVNAHPAFQGQELVERRIGDSMRTSTALARCRSGGQVTPPGRGWPPARGCAARRSQVKGGDHALGQRGLPLAVEGAARQAGARQRIRVDMAANPGRGRDRRQPLPCADSSQPSPRSPSRATGRQSSGSREFSSASACHRSTGSVLPCGAGSTAVKAAAVRQQLDLTQPTSAPAHLQHAASLSDAPSTTSPVPLGSPSAGQRARGPRGATAARTPPSVSRNRRGRGTTASPAGLAPQAFGPTRPVPLRPPRARGVAGHHRPLAHDAHAGHVPGALRCLHHQWVRSRESWNRARVTVSIRNDASVGRLRRSRSPARRRAEDGHVQRIVASVAVEIDPPSSKWRSTNVCWPSKWGATAVPPARSWSGASTGEIVAAGDSIPPARPVATAAKPAPSLNALLADSPPAGARISVSHHVLVGAGDGTGALVAPR